MRAPACGVFMEGNTSDLIDAYELSESCNGAISPNRSDLQMCSISCWSVSVLFLLGVLRLHQGCVHIPQCLLFEDFFLSKNTHWWLLPKAATLPPPVFSVQKWLLEISKRCMMGNKLKGF